MLPKTLTSKKFPEFIRKHKVAQQFPTPIKAFNDIGLQNCSEKITIDTNHYKASLTKSQTEYRKYLTTLFDGILSQSVADHIANTDIQFILDQYFSLSNKELCDSYRDCFAVKNGEYNICFSSHPWDIAMMNMRGISSCQRWEHEYARRLIGSVIDPYTAIIYLTDNTKLEHGTKMIKRAVVRVVANKKTGQPTLFVERIYPFDKFSKVNDYCTFEVFKDFLAKKTKNKFPIVFEVKGKFRNLTAPKTDALACILKKEYSYRDSKIKYSPLNIEDMPANNAKFWLSLKSKPVAK